MFGTHSLSALLLASGLLAAPSDPTPLAGGPGPLPQDDDPPAVQDDPPAPTSEELLAALYPSAGPAHELRFYSLRLRGEPELPPLVSALEALDPRAGLVHGPVSAPSNPGRAFLAVRVPHGVDERKLDRALKESGGRAERLHWALLRWTDPELPVGGLVAGARARALEPYRQRMLDLNGDVRWFEAVGPYTLHFFEPGEVSGSMLCERIARSVNSDRRGLFAVEVVRDRLTWRLAAPLNERNERRLRRELEDLPGLQRFELDPAAGELRFELELSDLPASDPAGQLSAFLAAEPTQEDGQFAPNPELQPLDLRPCYPTAPLRALLREFGAL